MSELCSDCGDIRRDETPCDFGYCLDLYKDYLGYSANHWHSLVPQYIRSGKLRVVKFLWFSYSWIKYE